MKGYRVVVDDGLVQAATTITAESEEAARKEEG